MKKKYKIGYTTGVFDLFHVEHLHILKQAKSMCDYLIVGVSTDELVEEYKGKTPVIPFEQRMEIVNAIKYVDKVIPQTTLDKSVAWEQEKFNVIFHGSDWNNSPLYNQNELKLKPKGVEFVYFPYNRGLSSTIIKEKCNLQENKND